MGGSSSSTGVVIDWSSPAYDSTLPLFNVSPSSPHDPFLSYRTLQLTTTMQPSPLPPTHRIVYKGRIYSACRPPPLSISCSLALVPVVGGGGGDGGVQV